MCGICGTYILNEIKNSNLVNSEILLKKINKINKDLSLSKLQVIKNNIAKYKSDINFLNFFHSPSERKNIRYIISLLKKIKKSNSSYKYVSLIDDLLFSLDIELINRYNFVKNKIDNKYLKNDHYIIFLKVLNSLINSINYLEMRGRDSLGLCIQIKFTKDQLKNVKNINKRKINISQYNDYILCTLVIKSSNPIGILRQNSVEILNEFFDNTDFIKLLNLQYLNIALFFHTRWASVGKINSNNTHPIADKLKINNNELITFSATNGDVYNYKEIIDKFKKNNHNINNKCQTDSLAISLVMGKTLNHKNLKIRNKLINSLEGSYCSCTISDLNPGIITLVKNGQQGLYVGNSVDRYYFSSDLYGLVEESERFYKVEDDCLIQLPINPNLSLPKIDIDYNKEKKINLNEFKKIEVSLSDIYLGKNPHYYYKEFIETPNIINKTNEKYINNKNNIEFDVNKFKNLKQLVIKNKIKKIIITGMGTCYTAAVAISHYMREMIVNYTKLETIIQPHMASEGSGFYTKKNMTDHLVIVLGQSGTTVDTNTYAKIAKERGAFTVSFLNKRQGDLSYLVDLNIYIGDGRDVEISVPSTKTYLAHINLGYIFTLMLIKNKENEKVINFEFNKILSLPNKIDKSIKSVQKINFENITNHFSINPNWYIIYDESPLSVTNLEIKIKLSELCYKSIPTFNLKNFTNLNIENSVVILNSSAEYTFLEKYINFFLKMKNIVMLASHDKRFNLIEHENFYFYSQDPMSSNFQIFNSILFFQFFSYKLAMKLNSRHKQINSYLNETNSIKKNLIFKEIINHIDLGFYNLDGFKFKIAKKLNQYHLKNIFKAKEDLINFSKLLMRPIDTVKHQAKTITVGATRDTLLKNKKIKKERKNLTTNKNIEYRNYYIYSNQLHESYIYDIVNIFSNQLEKKSFDFHLARSYDLNKISNSKLNFINLDSIYNKELKSIISVNDYLYLINSVYDFFEYKSIDIKKIEASLNSLDKQSILKLLNSKIKSFENIKIIGSGVNYNAAKLISLLLTKFYKKPISFEILENHKHIDVSAEPLLIILLGNIDKNIYHNDSLSEIMKFSSHNNKSIIFIDDINKKYYSKLPNDINKIIHKKINEQSSFCFYLSLFFKLYKFI